DAGLCYLLAQEHGALGTAAATAIAVSVGALAALATLWRLFGAGIPALSVLRVGAASAAVWGISQALPQTGRVLTAAKCAGLLLVYGAVLVATRELGGADW